MSSSVKIAEAWAVASCVEWLKNQVEEEAYSSLAPHQIRELGFHTKEDKEFIEEVVVREIVESIVSVVSGTLTEYMPSGAALYWNGNKFEHSIHCGCLCCQPSTPRTVRRNLFPDDDLDDDSDLSLSDDSDDSDGAQSALIEMVERLDVDLNGETEPVLEDRRCDGCGMYESDAIEDNPHEPEFIETGGDIWPPVRRCLCVSCFTTERDMFERSSVSYCSVCLVAHNPENPCNCADQWFVDREGNYVETDREYINEYENEELPENNTEKVKVVKDSVKEMGELVYDIQEKVSEGEYLQLMDCLQKITNAANAL